MQHTGSKKALITGQIDMAVLLTSSLQHSTLEYMPLSKNEILLSIPESHPVTKQKDPFKNGYDMLKMIILS